jgi:excisionase family DNA binding protein
MMKPDLTSLSNPVAVPDLDELEADSALADSLPVPVLADRARRAARLAADLQTALIARAVYGGLSPEPDRLLAVPKVAEILEFTEQYVYELIRRGHLPAVRSGKYVRVSASAVDSFIKNGPGNGVDSSIYHRGSSSGGRPHAAPAKDAGSLDTGGARRQARRRAEQGGLLAAQRADDRGADGATDLGNPRARESEA